jgi:hypothetical protein
VLCDANQVVIKFHAKAQRIKKIGNMSWPFAHECLNADRLNLIVVVMEAFESCYSGIIGDMKRAESG